MRRKIWGYRGRDVEIVFFRFWRSIVLRKKMSFMMWYRSKFEEGGYFLVFYGNIFIYFGNNDFYWYLLSCVIGIVC